MSLPIVIVVRINQLTKEGKGQALKPGQRVGSDGIIYGEPVPKGENEIVRVVIVRELGDINKGEFLEDGKVVDSNGNPVKYKIKKAINKAFKEAFKTKVIEQQRKEETPEEKDTVSNSSPLSKTKPLLSKTKPDLGNNDATNDTATNDTATNDTASDVVYNAEKHDADINDLSKISSEILKNIPDKIPEPPKKDPEEETPKEDPEKKMEYAEIFAGINYDGDFDKNTEKIKEDIAKLEIVQNEKYDKYRTAYYGLRDANESLKKFMRNGYYWTEQTKQNENGVKVIDEDKIKPKIEANTKELNELYTTAKNLYETYKTYKETEFEEYKKENLQLFKTKLFKLEDFFDATEKGRIKIYFKKKENDKDELNRVPYLTDEEIVLFEQLQEEMKERIFDATKPDGYFDDWYFNEKGKQNIKNKNAEFAKQYKEAEDENRRRAEDEIEQNKTSTKVKNAFGTVAVTTGKVALLTTAVAAAVALAPFTAVAGYFFIKAVKSIKVYDGGKTQKKQNPKTQKHSKNKTFRWKPKNHTRQGP